MDKIDAKDLLIEYYGTEEELRQAIKDDVIGEAVNEIADNNVDIYNDDLLKWAVENYDKIEYAIDEFGFPMTDGRADFLQAIRQGQYLDNESILYEVVEEITKGVK